MSNKLHPPFLLLGVALAIWVSAASLSDYLAGSLARKDGSAHQSGNATSGARSGAMGSGERSPKIVELAARIKADPKNVQLKMEQAQLLASESQRLGDGQLAMEGVQTLSEILEIDPKNSDALHILAGLCLDNGLFDKALGYYERYIQLKPDDLKARVDHALALLQLNRLDEAISGLNGVLAKSKNFFPAQLTLALAYRLKNDLPSARKTAEGALANAPDEMGKQTVLKFIDALQEPAAAQPKAAETESDLSPAQAVQSYFANHPIVGPKLVRVVWPAPSRAEVIVKDFPVDKMPPFAKEKFLTNTKNSLSSIEEPVTLQLKDETSGATLLEIEVGKSK